MSCGPIVCGVGFQIVMAVRRHRNPMLPDYTTKGEPRKGLWHPHSIVKEGRLDWLNVFRVFILSCLYAGIDLGIFVTMYFAHQAGLNVGIITALWGISPLIMSICERLIFGTPLLFTNVIGIVFMIGSTVCVSLSNGSVK